MDNYVIKEVDSHGIERYWNAKNKYHRTDGPALINPKGAMVWYINGKKHRTDGPAVINNTQMAWLVNGRLHRLDGPAIVYHNGENSYYIDGVRLTEEDFNKHPSVIFCGPKKDTSTELKDQYETKILHLPCRQGRQDHYGL